jgi:hypothetical protein
MEGLHFHRQYLPDYISIIASFQRRLVELQKDETLQQSRWERSGPKSKSKHQFGETKL